jgi:hypothetical protein
MFLGIGSGHRNSIKFLLYNRINCLLLLGYVINNLYFRKGEIRNFLEGKFYERDIIRINDF